MSPLRFMEVCQDDNDLGWALNLPQYCIKREAILIVLVPSPVTKSPPDVLVALNKGCFGPVPQKTYLSVEIWIIVLVLKPWLLDRCFSSPVNIWFKYYLHIYLNHYILRVNNASCHKKVANLSCLTQLKFSPCSSKSNKLFLVCKWPSLHGPWRAQASSVLWPYPPLWILGVLFSQQAVEERVEGLPVTSLQVQGLGVVWISSAHISLGKSQTNNYKEGWKTWLNCVPRKERKERWFLWRVQLAIFITVI